jgi:hypothetical protein
MQAEAGLLEAHARSVREAEAGMTERVPGPFFTSVPERVNELTDASDDALALRSLIGSSHQAIRTLGLTVLPLRVGFLNRIEGRQVSAPRLPKYLELAHLTLRSVDG